LKEGLRDPEQAASYLNACLAGGSREVFLLALRHVAAAHGIGSVAKQSDLGRESLYRTLSAKGNPRLETLLRLLDTAGLRLSVEAKQRKPRAAAPAVSAKVSARANFKAFDKIMRRRSGKPPRKGDEMPS
jgi:probable addiction module antidote protein